MIKTFKNRSLKKLYEKNDKSKINPNHLERIVDILIVLHYLKNISDIDTVTWDLHQLKGRLKGFWSMSVSGNYRVWFRFENQNAYDVDYGDYH